MLKRYHVDLTGRERSELLGLLNKGIAPARTLTRARIQLAADEHKTDAEIAASLHVHPATVERTRRRFVEGRAARAIHEKPRPGGHPKLDPKQEAFLVALACSKAPSGRRHWTLQLLADRLVELGVVETISDETVRRAIKKNTLKPWARKQWCIASVGADFVWRMEDVLDLYAEPYKADRPVVCFDELPFQLLADTRAPQPASPGHPARVDYEYRRQGTVNLFVCFEPLAGWRHVEVTARRTNKDFAEQMRALVDERYPEAARIAVVLDNLSTHSPAALYQTVPPAEARRLVKRLEFHYTPRHGSWLNMAELEFAILSRQCLHRRLPDQTTLRREIAAWEAERNTLKATAHWRFTTAKARSKLRRLYPA
ncbi:IS630 family transposase [Microvirga sp. KLBC 81]|uniref:IS630 family transposase n=1 Tax=Microvirga sp. KLBC 81 TaxID=1862707 RepID=UPI000D51DE6F|nr:IS630 family transposase [Microvirga sp. KLBC 81]PVE20569.1 IS630 family transposase [Microvirga sp. KLBC 81]